MDDLESAFATDPSTGTNLAPRSLCVEKRVIVSKIRGDVIKVFSSQLTTSLSKSLVKILLKRPRPGY